MGQKNQDQKLDAGAAIFAKIREMGVAARAASRRMARADTATKNQALLAAAAEVRKQAKNILAANAAKLSLDMTSVAFPLLSPNPKEALEEFRKCKPDYILKRPTALPSLVFQKNVKRFRG